MDESCGMWIKSWYSFYKYIKKVRKTKFHMQYGFCKNQVIFTGNCPSGNLFSKYDLVEEFIIEVIKFLKNATRWVVLFKYWKSRFLGNINGRDVRLLLSFFFCNLHYLFSTFLLLPTFITCCPLGLRRGGRGSYRWEILAIWPLLILHKSHLRESVIWTWVFFEVLWSPSSINFSIT